MFLTWDALESTLDVVCFILAGYGFVARRSGPVHVICADAWVSENLTFDIGIRRTQLIRSFRQVPPLLLEHREL